MRNDTSGFLIVGFTTISIITIYVIWISGIMLPSLFFMFAYLISAIMISLIRFSMVKMKTFAMHLMFASALSLVYFSTITEGILLHYYALFAGIIGTTVGLIISFFDTPYRKRGSRKKNRSSSAGFFMAFFVIFFLFMFPILIPESIVEEKIVEREEDQEQDEITPSGLPDAPFLWLESESITDSLEVELNWSSVENAIYYSLYRHSVEITDDNIDSARKILQTSSLSHVDYLSESGTYYYSVTSRNCNGTSPVSNPVKVIILSQGYVWPFTSSDLYIYDNELNLTDHDVKIGLNTEDDDIQLRYHFDEIYGTEVHDSSIYSNNGTLNSAGTWIDGKINGGFDFSGIGYIDCGNDQRYNFGKNDVFSMDFWMKSGPVGAGQFIVSRNTVLDGEGWYVYLNPTYDMYFMMRDQLGNYISGRVNNTGNILNNNTWQHVYLVFNGITANPIMDCWINATHVGMLSISNTFVPASDPDISTSMTLGKRSGSNPNYYYGNLDEFSIYNKSLTQNEIEYRYNNHSGNDRFFYHNGTFVIENIVSYNFTKTISTFYAEDDIPNDCGVRYILSYDNGSIWMFYNGYEWVPSSETFETANTETTICANINSLTDYGCLKWKIFMRNEIGDGTSTPILDNVAVEL